MSFLDAVARAKAYLETHGRVSLRGLRRESRLDDADLEALVEELVAVQGVATREGEVLVWAGAHPPTRPPPRRSPAAAERRQLTVMFVDVVGSTSLAEDTDPEDFAAVLEAYQHACRGCVASWGGFIARPLGDGLVIYFGYPQAQEDAPARAVRAALDIVRAIDPLNRALAVRYPVLVERPLQVRVGVHTGLTVVGDVATAGTPEQVAVGETPNLAARLQSVAGPNEVVISDATLRLLSEQFQTRDLGTLALKGIAAPVRAHRVLRAAPRSRFDVDPRRLTPLTGREREVEFLRDRWRRARDGAGQIVLVSGEAGIGKSRLLRALRDSLAGEPHLWLESHSSPYTRESEFQPLGELLAAGLGSQSVDGVDGVDGNDGSDDKHAAVARLERGVEAANLPADAIVPYLAALLSIDLPERYPPRAESPARLRQRIMDAATAWLSATARRRPLVLVVEDLHWCDASTIEFLGQFLAASSTLPVLTVLSFRPDFEPPWGARSHLTRLEVSRLQRSEAEQLIHGMVRDQLFPAPVAARIVERADGVPIFLEELTKWALESGAATGLASEGRGAPPSEFPIPATLQDSLMARLDRLGPAKEIAQLGATLGREFSYELIAAVAPFGASRLRRELERLVDAEFLYRLDSQARPRYHFKHALIQDMAYQSLLRSHRQAHHQRIARVLEEKFPEIGQQQPELLARHYTEAGHGERAIAHWQRAGQRSLERSAHVEAISHLTAGLALVGALPETPSRARQELALQLPLGTAYLMNRGYAVPEVGEAYRRAYELCQRLEDAPELIPTLFGLWRYYMARPDYRTARRLSEQLLGLAQQPGDAAHLVLGHYALGSAFHLLGDPAATRSHMERGLEHYDPERHRSLAGRAGFDPAVTCRAVAAHAFWELGFPDRARAECERANAAADSLAHPPSRAFALLWAALLAAFSGEPERTREASERAIDCCREHGIAAFLAMGQVLRGWARCEQGAHQNGIAELEASLTALRNQGTELFWTTWMALRARAHARVGQVEAGLRAVADGLAAAEQNGERYWEAELYRLRGELTRARRSGGDPEASLRKALELARASGARAWELRAAMSLARLLAERGDREAARAGLAPLYHSFEEGFDTPDLRKAQALLAGL